MGLVIKKTTKDSEMGAVGKITSKDKLKAAKIQYKVAKRQLPDYAKLRKELGEFEIELPSEVDKPDLSSINALYAIAQSFYTRTSSIESTAVYNHSLWDRAYNLLYAFIKDKESKLLISEEAQQYSNKDSQQAFIRTKLSAAYDKLETIKDYKIEAEAFCKEVEIKKKDIDRSMINLTRQVKTYKTEFGGY